MLPAISHPSVASDERSGTAATQAQSANAESSGRGSHCAGMVRAPPAGSASSSRCGSGGATSSAVRLGLGAAVDLVGDQQDEPVEPGTLERRFGDVREYFVHLVAVLKERAADAEEQVAVAQGVDRFLARHIEVAEDAAEVVRHEGDEHRRDDSADEAVEVAIAPRSLHAVAERGDAEDVGDRVRDGEHEYAPEVEEEGRDEQGGERVVVVGAAPAAAQVDGGHRERDIEEAHDEHVLVLRDVDALA